MRSQQAVNFRLHVMSRELDFLPAVHEDLNNNDVYQLSPPPRRRNHPRRPRYRRHWQWCVMVCGGTLWYVEVRVGTRWYTTVRAETEAAVA